MDVEKIVAAYVKIRDARSQLKKEFTTADDALKEKLSRLDSALTDHLKATGQTGAKTPVGTVSRVLKTKFWPSDWDAFFTYMEDFGGAQVFMTRNLNQTVFKEFIENNPDAKPPINSDSSYSISVRKGGTK